MASVHRRPNSKYWHAAFRDSNGRLILCSTKCVDRTKALVTALEFERAANLARSGNLIEAQARKVVAGIMERAGSEETLRTASIADYFNQWLTSKQSNKSANTGDRYRIAVEKFLEVLKEGQKKPLTSLTARDIERYMQARTKEKLAPRTIILCVKIIRTALNAARRQGLIPTNPAEAVELPKNKGMERGTFTGPEVKILLDTAKGEWQTLIMLGYFTGARLSDCCRMQWADIDFAKGTLTYTQAKTGEKVTIVIHPDLRAHLEKIAGVDRPQVFIMPHMAGLKPGGRHGLSEGFKRIMRNAGLDLQTVKGSGIRQQSKRTFHALRHTFTSELANKGVSPELRMKLTGHKTESVHRGYTHHEIEKLREAVEKIPSLN